MATLQVLCPNGRRQNVKITPNSKLLQVLEEVCKKQGYIPVEDYKLIHGRKDLDLSLSFRYANLPNNAKLELLKLEKSRAEEMVLIALQLESGQRLQHQFPPSTALWDILQHWENQSSEHQGKLTHVDASQKPPTHPVCIYMIEEVIGECALKRRTLRKLGLTGGRAVIRLVHRPVDDSVIAEIMNKVEKEMLKEAKLGEIAARKQAEMQESQSETQSRMSSSSSSLQETSRDLPKKSATEHSSLSMTDTGEQESKMDAESCDKSSDVIDQEAMDVDQGEGQASGSLSNPNAISRYSARSQPPVGASGQSSIEQLRSMNIPGVEIFTPQDFEDLPPDQQQVARALAQKLMRNLIGGATQQPTNQRAPRQIQAPAQHQFSEFKFPEATRGQTLYSNELSEVSREEYQPCDREAVVFSLEETITSKTSTEEVPEDVFDLTESDLRTLMTDLKTKVDNLSETPLMTKAMRQAKLEERYSHYKTVVIRVQFPDKLVLQGLFRPRETVFAVQKFVKENMQDKSTPFYLYTTPPKNVLKDKTMTLIEAELVPATRIYFGSECQYEHHLSEAVRMEISPREHAEKIAFQSLPSCEGEDEGNTGEKKEPEQQKKVKSSSSGGKAPKWLKLGKR